MKLQTIKDLKQDVQKLMKNSNNKENGNNQAETNILTRHSKIEEMASNTIGRNQNKRVIPFTEETMKTIKDFVKQLKMQLASNQTQ